MTTSDPSDRLAPHSLDAEQGVLGCILLASECLDDCLAELTHGVNVFYDLKHQLIYAAMLALHRDHQIVETISVMQRLKDNRQIDEAGGLAYVSSLPDGVPTPVILPKYLKTVVEKFHRRRLIQLSLSTVERAYNEDDVQALLADTENAVARIDSAQSSHILDGLETSERFVEDLQKRYDLQGARSGISTGWTKFDELTDGLQYGEQTVIAARPSVGKSALAINIVEKVCLRDNTPSVFVTLEMSAAALVKRMFSSQHRVTMKALRNGRLEKTEFEAVATFRKSLAESKLTIIEGIGGMSVTLMCALVKRAWRKKGVKLVVIDYLQKLLPPTGRFEKRTYEVGAVSTTLRALAVDLNVAMVTLAQLNRDADKEKNRTPRLADIRDSGQIEQDADVVGLLHRTWDKPYEAQLIIAKQRDGETGIVDLTFNGSYCRFENPKPV